MHPLIKELSSLDNGDLQSFDGAAAVRARVLDEPELFGILIHGISEPDVVVARRVADTADQVSLKRPELLVPHKLDLFALAGETTDAGLRRNLARMLARLPLGPLERRDAIDLLAGYLDDEDEDARAVAAQVLPEIAGEDRVLRKLVAPLMKRVQADSSPTVRRRAMRLLKDH